MDTLIDEILKGCKYDGSYIPVTEVRRLMQLYHEAKLKEITEHKTCDGCKMFQDCGCMLDLSLIHI